MTDYEVIANSFKSDNRQIGLVLEPERRPGRPEVGAYVRRWSDIIAENKRLLDFVTSSLEFDPSLAEGLLFIREEYAEMIPQGLAADEEPGDTESD